MDAKDAAGKALKVVVKNQGFGPAGGFYVRQYWGWDGQSSRVYVAGLKAGGSLTLRFDDRTSNCEGYVADVYNQVRELNENNNYFSVYPCIG